MSDKKYTFEDAKDEVASLIMHGMQSNVNYKGWWEWQRYCFPSTERTKLAYDEAAQRYGDYREQLGAVKFAEWLEGLTPAQRCTVHPPAGSGGSSGIYTLSISELYKRFAASPPKTEKAG
jgi:hypothetical protein